jgi:hypothetical protein
VFLGLPKPIVAAFQALSIFSAGNPDQPVFSPGMLVDVVWLLFFPVMALA